MEEEMEVEMEEAEVECGEEDQVFVVQEVDLDYEYDAPMFFDFTRAEFVAEAREAESWFDSAGSYPPSPFVVKLIMRDEMLLGNINVSPKSRIIQDSHDADYRDSNTIAGGHEGHETVVERAGIFSNLGNLATVSNKPPEFCGGLMLGHETLQHKVMAKAKSSAKPFWSKGSTLMKPTASQLAKQNHSSKVANSRCQMQLGQLRGKGFCSFGTESQAVKRQKLEGGELFKVFEVQQQADFIHKAPKKDEIVEESCRARLRLTIPREPDLATAHRAQRTRPKTIFEGEQAAVTVRTFKARPLNRKIFEAPVLPLTKKSAPRAPKFQVFHLKTQQRAIQHGSTASTTSCCLDSDKGLLPSCSVAEREQKNSQRVIGAASSRLYEMDSKHTFKAHPLDKKIFSSKGDIGVLRNVKRETTVPVEFKFNSEKRIPQTPPVDLFSKLSIKSELQPSTGSHTQTRAPQSCCGFSKGPKENRFRFFPENNEIAQSVKHKPPPSGVKQNHFGREQAAGERCTSFSTRSLGMC